MGEGRWIQDVKVNPAQRRARIATLQRAQRLRVCVQMPQWRLEHQITQGRVGLSGCAVLAQCALSGSDAAHAPQEDQNTKNSIAGVVADDVDPASAKTQSHHRASRKRKAGVQHPAPAQERVQHSNRAGTRCEVAADVENRAAVPEATEVVTHSAAVQAAPAAGGATMGWPFRARARRKKSGSGVGTQAGIGDVTDTVKHHRKGARCGGGCAVGSAAAPPPECGACENHSENHSEGAGEKARTVEPAQRRTRSRGPAEECSAGAAADSALPSTSDHRGTPGQENEGSNARPSACPQDVPGVEVLEGSGARKRARSRGSTKQRASTSAKERDGRREEVISPGTATKTERKSCRGGQKKRIVDV